DIPPSGREDPPPSGNADIRPVDAKTHRPPGTRTSAVPMTSASLPEERRVLMSLTVPNDLLERARAGEVDDESFLACVRDSLPYAWETICRLVEERKRTGAPFADNQVPPPDETARGQLLRCMASDAMRGAIERHFGVRL